MSYRREMQANRPDYSAPLRQIAFRRVYFLCVKLKRFPEGSWNTASMP